MKTTSILFLFTALLFTSCKKVQPPINQTNAGCDCANEVTADFDILDISAYNQTDEMLTVTDSIFSDRNVRFSAKEKNAQYTWYIGADVVTDSAVARYFDQSLAGQSFPITLVVKKKPNLICFPNDDGYDSIVKWIHVSNWDGSLYNLPPYRTFMEGTYRMKEKNGLDSMDIEIDFYDDAPFSPPTGVRIINSKGLNDTIYTGYPFNSFREIRTIYSYVGNFRNKLNGEAEFIYEDRTVTPRVNRYFLGRKL